MDRGEIRFNLAALREQRLLGSATWRPPLHGSWILAIPEGRVCAQVKEVGFRLPRKDRRYAAKIEGVEWWTTNRFSDRARFLTVRGFLTPEDAMAAVDEARLLILSSKDEDAVP